MRKTPRSNRRDNGRGRWGFNCALEQLHFPLTDHLATTKTSKDNDNDNDNDNNNDKGNGKGNNYDKEVQQGGTMGGGIKVLIVHWSSSWEVAG